MNNSNKFILTDALLSTRCHSIFVYLISILFSHFLYRIFSLVFDVMYFFSSVFWMYYLHCNILMVNLVWMEFIVRYIFKLKFHWVNSYRWAFFLFKKKKNKLIRYVNNFWKKLRLVFYMNFYAFNFGLFLSSGSILCWNRVEGKIS